MLADLPPSEVFVMNANGLKAGLHVLTVHIDGTACVGFDNPPLNLSITGAQVWDTVQVKTLA